MQAQDDEPLNRPRRRRRDRVELPPLSTIERWKKVEHLTYQSMVERWYYETDGRELATPAAFAMVCSRHGWTGEAVQQPVIPWVVETRHQNKYKLQMLRSEGRRRRGETLPVKVESKLDFFLSQRVGKTVILYEPNTPQGFWDVPVEWFDDDIIRDPALRALEGTKAPTASRRKAVIDAARERFYGA
jgi:hypothetical protein